MVSEAIDRAAGEQALLRFGDGEQAHLNAPDAGSRRTCRRIFQQPYTADLHRLVGSLGHVVDGQAGDETAVKASISTPVLPVSLTVAVTRRPGRAGPA
jgi:hypothetical protein